MLKKFADGRTDLVFDLIAQGHPASLADEDGVPLMQWCAYYGDVSAIRFLLAQGEPLSALGDNLGLDTACFHGHWRLCQFAIEHGADVNRADAETGETPLHSAICRTDPAQNLVVKVLLASGADPKKITKAGAETGGFMRDCRVKGETPLHRAAAFGDEEMIQMLLDAGAKVDAKDANGDSPLGWASWYLRPASLLRKLCYGNFRIRAESRTMRANLQGFPAD